MKLYHVVAMANNRVIGKDNRLPWHFLEDLKRFKKLTIGNTLLMGRKTFESIGAKPLPGRENFVVSRSKPTPFLFLPPQVGEDKGGGVKFFDSIEKAIQAVSTKHCYIIGGASIFEQTMDKIDGIYLTQIHADYEGDAFYPEIPNRLREKERITSPENPKLEYITYEKK